MVEQNVNLRRAIFVYEAARLEAEVSGRPIVPEPWDERDEAFKIQFVKVVDRQCSDDKFLSAEARPRFLVAGIRTHGVAIRA